MNSLAYINIEFGPGRYFIGDICYALSDDIYDQVWGGNNYEDGKYEGFGVAGTMYGDGCYQGTDGNDYGVDAGNIGIVNITDVQRYDNQDLERLGSIVEVKESIVMERTEKGEFIFHIDGDYAFSIATGGNDEY